MSLSQSLLPVVSEKPSSTRRYYLALDLPASTDITTLLSSLTTQVCKSGGDIGLVGERRICDLLTGILQASNVTPERARDVQRCHVQIPPVEQLSQMMYIVTTRDDYKRLVDTVVDHERKRRSLCERQKTHRISRGTTTDVKIRPPPALPVIVTVEGANMDPEVYVTMFGGRFPTIYETYNDLSYYS